MSLNRRVFTQSIAAVGVTAAAPAMAAATIEVTMKNNPKAIFVPARLRSPRRARPRATCGRRATCRSARPPE